MCAAVGKQTHHRACVCMACSHRSPALLRVLYTAADELWTDEVCRYLTEAYPALEENGFQHLRMCIRSLRPECLLGFC